MLLPNSSVLSWSIKSIPTKEFPISPPKSVEKNSPGEMRAELVSLLSDCVLRYLAKREIDHGHRQPQVSVESVEGAHEVSSKPRFSVTIPVHGL